MTDEPLKGITAAELVDAAPDGMLVVGDQGEIVLVNRQLEGLFGYRRDELVGELIEVLVPGAARGTHRAHRTRYRADPTNRPMGAGLRLMGQRKDGTEFPVEISLSPLPTGGGLLVVAAVRDITERLAAEAESREVHRVLDTTQDAVLMFDAETLRFTYVNEGAISQLGYSRDELLSMTPLHVKPDFTEPEYRALVASVPPGGSHTYTTTHRRKDGEDIPVEAVLQRPPEGDHDGRRWMVSIARDLRERLAMEERAQQAQREIAVLEDRQRIARDLHDRVIQRLFAAGLGIEAVRGRVQDPHVGERLQQIVGDLDGTITELRSSIFALNATSSAPSLRAKVIGVCSDERQALGFDPSVRFAGPVDTVGDGLGEDLLAVLREALSNVARHARAGSVQVTVDARDGLLLRVEDDGAGLQAEGGRHGGHGLGNMAARAEKLGGEFVLEPGSRSGTRLTWHVPVA
ncbi:MAG TPA: PAS domain S-box protein [Acidimicrobiales bacterium]|nr:PAS domain S-box protein [Acidimicrobiales bacterium]